MTIRRFLLRLRAWSGSGGADGGAETPDPGAQRAERLVVALALAVLVGAVLWSAPGYVRGDEPLGADASSHILASATIARHLQDGSPGWWMPSLNLGFPLAHYYQPLPHCATAVLALALGGPERATVAYKLLVVLLLCLGPITTYAGLRRLDLSRAAALVAAIALATLSTRQESYGLTARHYLFLGLYTLLFGAVFLPLALAEGVRFVQGRGRLSRAVAWFGLLFLSHGLLALGLIPLFALVAFFVPHEHEQRARLGAGRALLDRLGRLVTLGALSGAFLAFWLLPQLACSDYFNGWPIPMGEMTDGVGLSALLADWAQGGLLDLRRPPVLTVLSSLGVLLAVAGARRRAAQRAVLAGVVLFLVFTAGRATFGNVLDWTFPPNARIEGMARWVAMLQFFLALAAGLAGELLVRGLQRLPALARRSWVPLASVSALVLGLAFPRHVELLSRGLTTFPPEYDRAAYVAVADAIARDPAEGRVYTREGLGHSSHWAMTYLTMLTGKPMTISYAVGGQDSLSLFYLWYFRILDPESAPALVRLFDIRYLLKQPGQALPHLPSKFVARQGPYEVSRLLGDYGLFEWVAEPRVLEARTPVEARRACMRWMLEEYPRGASFLRLPEPIEAKTPSLPSTNFELGGNEPLDRTKIAVAPAVDGKVLEEEAGSSRFAAHVRLADESAWLLLKVTAHPFWAAEVDGRAAPVYYLSPSFMGLPLARGEHRVEFTFRAPAWQKALLAVAPIVLAALVAVELRARRRAKRAIRGPALRRAGAGTTGFERKKPEADCPGIESN
jgi:hypothetical protein